MKTLPGYVLAAIVTLALPVTGAIAQNAGPHKTHEHHRLSPEAQGRLLDGRIAGAKTALQLSDAQLKLFAPVEDLIRKSHENREKMRAEWEAARKDGEKRPQVDLPERLAKVSERMTKRAEHAKALSEALKPLYASFNDSQKAVAGPVFAQLLHNGEHHRHGGWQRG